MQALYFFIFSPCCCYFIIYIFLSGFRLIYWTKLLLLSIYWTKLLLLSTQLLLHEIVPIQPLMNFDGFIYLQTQRAIPLDVAMLYRYWPLTKNYNFETYIQSKKFFLIPILKINKLLNYIFTELLLTNIWHICDAIFVT